MLAYADEQLQAWLSRPRPSVGSAQRWPSGRRARRVQRTSARISPCISQFMETQGGQGTPWTYVEARTDSPTCGNAVSKR